MDGTYRSMHTFGYGRNGGYAYTMNANDWQQMWYALERHSLLAPEAPLGVGVVLGTSRFNDPQHAEFSGGGMGGSSLDANVSDVANVVRRMQDGGISVPFSTNAATLANWKGSAPLLLLNLSEFSDTEIGAVRAAITRGARVAAFSGAGTLPKSAAVLFGVTADGVPTSGQSAGKWRGKPVVLTNSTILMLGSYSTLESEDLNVLGPILKQGLDLPITFAAGTSGYGFKMEGRSYIEVEDWLETGRTVSIRLKADPKAQSARACELNENHSVPVTREGNDWVMTFPIKPADANVICVEEQL